MTARVVLAVLAGYVLGHMHGRTAGYLDAAADAAGHVVREAAAAVIAGVEKAEGRP